MGDIYFKKYFKEDHILCELYSLTMRIKPTSAHESV